jgi:hypothetical protein
MVALPSTTFDLVRKRRRHAMNLTGQVANGDDDTGFQVFELSCEKELAFRLRQRTAGDREEVRKLLPLPRMSRQYLTRQIQPRV